MVDNLPVFIQALSENTSNKSHFREIVREYGKSLQEMWGKDKIWVWDSAGYTEQTIKEISGSYKWISRVSETLKKGEFIVATNVPDRCDIFRFFILLSKTF
jgi:transposase